MRRSLNQWFERHRLRPHIVAEFADSALLKVFGADGVGVFPAPAAVAGDVEKQYRVERLGPAEEVVERFYAISAERRLRNPAVIAISQAAHLELSDSRGPGATRSRDRGRGVDSRRWWGS